MVNVIDIDVRFFFIWMRTINSTLSIESLDDWHVNVINSRSNQIESRIACSTNYSRAMILFDLIVIVHPLFSIKTDPVSDDYATILFDSCKQNISIGWILGFLIADENHWSLFRRFHSFLLSKLIVIDSSILQTNLRSFSRQRFNTNNSRTTMPSKWINAKANWHRKNKEKTRSAVNSSLWTHQPWNTFVNGFDSWKFWRGMLCWNILLCSLQWIIVIF